MVTNHIQRGFRKVDVHGSTSIESSDSSGRAFCHVLLATVDETPQPAASFAPLVYCFSVPFCQTIPVIPPTRILHIATDVTLFLALSGTYIHTVHDTE
jgi:hypothetical protein